MRVLITGGTGFVGSHAVAALYVAGHDVRLLVRDPRRIERALNPLGVSVVDHAVGDVTDPTSVAAALEGCDAVIHTAAMVTLDPRRRAEATRVNVGGTRTVLSESCRRGLDPVVHVSSVAALDQTAGPILTPDSLVARSDAVYAASKAGAERAARELQADGAPVTIVYPGGVWGPQDPNMGEQTRAVCWIVRLGLTLQADGGYPVVDVRDVATALATALTPGRGPRRYLFGGTYFEGRQLAALVSGLIGRRIFALAAPEWSLRATGWLGDRLNSALNLQLPFTAEAMDVLIHTVPTDDSRTHRDLGVSPRDPAETVTDTLRWLYAQGAVSARQIGKLAAQPSEAPDGTGG